MNRHRISILITNYNRAKFLDRAIRSCLDQLLFSNIQTEIIVVDDGSTDESQRMLEMFKPSITLIQHERNKGVAAASNTGLKNATGEFVIRLDADDFLNKMAIYIMSNILLENPDIDYVYTDHFRVNELGFKEKRVKLDTREQLYEHGAGVLFRKKIFDTVKGYDETLKNCEDYDLLIRINEKFNGFYLPVALYRYYIHGENLTLKAEREAYKKMVRKRHGL